jgi:hypothetical protein
MNRVLHGTDGLVMSLDTRLRFAARSRASKTGEPEVLARYDSAASSRVGIGNSSGDAMTVRGDIRDVSWSAPEAPPCTDENTHRGLGAMWT